MDYIEQIEKLYKYFEFNLEFNLMRSLINMKHDFNDDLNLIGCFIKDFLTAKNSGIVSDDEYIYNDFVLYFEKTKEKSNEIVEDIIAYSKYYLGIVFEDFKDKEILNVVSTVNSCYALEYYPHLMKLLDKYYNQKMDVNRFDMMLKFIVEAAIKKLEVDDCEEDIKNLETEINKTVFNDSFDFERIAI